ncbi:MAG TPA: aminotransferase class V-fold PLP-dependent enzyme, partial [Candidatus Krumholzibacteria bacterium]
MAHTTTHAPLDVARVRGDFPALAEVIHGKPLVYLDNAATSQKPRAVIDAMTNYYAHSNANVHRGVHTLSVRATELYEGTREKVRALINATELAEIIFVRGTTEAINLVASSFGAANVKAGDEIVISTLEHHSNIVPWQMLCQRTGAKLRVIPIDYAGELVMDEYRTLLNERTRLVAIAHVSNSLGTVNPLREII